MISFLTHEVKVTRVLNAVAAGTTDQNSAVVDTQGWDGVMFIAAFGALTATQVTLLKAQHGAQANLSDAADITGGATAALADGDGNKCLIVDVRASSSKRYVRAVVDRGTANAVIDGVIAIQYRARHKPGSHDTSVKEAVAVVAA